MLRYTYTGTHLGELLGVPATGNGVMVHGLEIDTVEGGKIVQTYNFTDFYGLLAQIGGI